jgi:superfamily II DNA helicase RecQ
VGDIIRQLGMVKPDGFKGSFFRSNLILTAHRKGDGRGSRKDILAYVRRRRGDSGIIYALSRKNVDSLADFLRSAGVRAVPYHAGLDDAVRTRHQDAFARDEVDVVVATIAFGMGIDKSNVRYVIHREMPRSIENYYQEIGRAGRDGLASDCILLFSYADVVSHGRFQSGPRRPRPPAGRAREDARHVRAGGVERLPAREPRLVLRRAHRRVRHVVRPLLGHLVHVARGARGPRAAGGHGRRAAARGR